MQQERYLDVIEEALLAFGSDHAALSALDVQVVLGWQQAGIPLAIALKGIRQGVHVFERTRKAEDPFPRRLAYFSTWVQKLHQRARARVFLAPEPAPPSAARAPTRASDAAEPSPTYQALQAELAQVVSGAPALIADAVAGLAAQAAEHQAELAADPDLPLAWAVDANQRLADAALAALAPETAAALTRTAQAAVRARFPLATPDALAARTRVELRRLLGDQAAVRFFDLRELSR